MYLKKYNDYYKDYEDSEILINEIDYTGLNAENFMKKFQMIKLIYNGEEKWIDFNSRIFQDLSEKEQILSVSFAGGRTVYLLLNRDNEFDWDAFFEEEKFSSFSKKEIFITDEDLKKEQNENTDQAFNLLLNSLAKEEPNLSNINGQLYIYVNQKKNFEIVTTMRVSVKNKKLRRTQQKFSKLSKNTKTDESKYTIKYALNNSVIIEPCYKNITEDLYVKKSFDMSKSNICYDYLSLEKQKISRIEILHNLINDFNINHKDIAELKFAKNPVKFKKIESYENIKKEKNEDLKNLLQINLIIFDKHDINDEIKTIISYFETFIKNMGLSCKISENYDKDGLNICFIHNKNYYEEKNIEDIKNKIPFNVISQCILYENFDETFKKDDIKNIANTCLSELFVKKELKLGKIKRWKHGYMSFYLGIRNKNEMGIEAKHCKMDIYPDGSFKISDDENEIGSEFTKYINNLKTYSDKPKNGSICIVKKGDDLNLIEHTDYMPVMDIESKKSLEKYSKQMNYKTRSRKSEFLADKMSYPYVGKIVMTIDGQLHYTIGHSNNPKQSIPTLNNIYKVKSLKKSNSENSDIIFEITELLKDNYVRSNHAESVRPYPFKYMIEYMRIKNHAYDTYF